MKRKLFLLFVLFSFSVSAHEFWLQPNRYIFQKGERAKINFRVGENFEGENWNGNREKVNFLALHNGNEVSDISQLLSSNKGDSLELVLSTEGTQMLVYNGLNSFIELDAQKFREYAEEDGLTDALEYRKLHNETDSVSRENYQRCSKTILQVGTVKNDHITTGTKLPLDIIPIVHPHKLKSGGAMKLKLVFMRQPFTNGLVNVWHREKGKTSRIKLISDDKGVISFPCSTSGAWMVSAVKMVRAENDPRAQWQSYWSSCTWGY